jgi:excinuclease ABC subunit C
MDLDAIQAQKDMQYIMNFFKWNTDPVEKEIREKITDAIEKQHFERAAKLRDMLLHMEQFTEKQTAVLSQPLSWHIAEIREVWNRRVYVVLYLYQWKIIDVIRQKIPKDDYEKDSLLVVLNNEYWNFEEKYDMYLAMSKSPKKEDRQELKKFIDRCFESFIATNAFQEWTLLNDLLKTLQERYDLSVFPYRIECLDISHLSGWWASGGLSCVVWGIKYPHGYRKYKIAEDHAGDDYASLEEVVLRRFSYDQEFLNLPNIFVLDWWKWQLQTIKRCLEKNPEIANRCEHIQFVSLWKWEARDKNRIWKQKKGEIISEKLYVLDHWSIKETPFIYDAADQILLHLRDEAHRFANAYRTKQMSQEFTEKPKKK